MLVCTVNCVCTLTPVHGSCTSSLRWLRLCLPLCCQPRRREGRNPRERTNPINEQYPLLCVLCVLSSLTSYPLSSQLEYLLLLLQNTSQILCFTMIQSPSFSLYGPPFFTCCEFLLIKFKMIFCTVCLLLHRIVVWWGKWERTHIYPL